MHILKILCLLLMTYDVYPLPSSRNGSDEEIQYRLPTGVVPVNYAIDLTFLDSSGINRELLGIAFTNVGNTFSGKVKIEFMLLEEISNLKFHASNDYISITTLTLNNENLSSNQYTVDPSTDLVTVSLDGRSLPQNQSLYVEIEYTGKISTTDSYGVYRSSYTKPDGDVSYLLATQLQPTYARRVFPCFDEPSFKATFDMSITYYSDEEMGLDLGVLFNTDVLNKGNETDSLTTITFEKTPVMSAYLLAFVISDFGSTNGATINGAKYAVWSREDQASSRDYAVEIGPKILTALDNFMGRNYSTDILKVDQVALPDLEIGAMENWGLVTYREKYLLFNQNDTDDTAKKAIATLIAHELAHQWFGNLITCDWWSETFLNEGFATYFEYFTTHEVESTWSLDKQFVVDVLHLALNSDSLENSQALKSEAASPQEISDKFGTITYKKGGSILRMLSHIMGEDNFKEAMREYVHTNELQYATTTSSDLWRVFQTKIQAQYSTFPENATLATIMENWIEKPGYPLLSVGLSGQNLTISQERFLLSGEDKESRWFVPITYAESQSETKFQVTATSAWLTPSTQEITITLEQENDWVVLNTLQTGFYRVNYDTTLWKNIATALQKDNFDGIVELNRAQIIDDVFNLVKANKLTYEEVFNVIEFLKNDLSYFVWYPAFTGFNHILLRISKSSQLNLKIKEHVLSLMKAIYESVPINQTNDDQIYTLTQQLASSWACKLEEQNCVTESRRLFVESVQNGIKPHKSIRSVVYCNGLRYSNNTSDYDYLWQLYINTEDPNEKLIILNALGCSTNQDKLKEYLEETLKDDSEIRAQDAELAFAAVYDGSEEGVDTALSFLIDNFKVILAKYPSMRVRSTLIKGIAARLTTTEQVNKLKEFFASNSEFEVDLKDLSEEALEQAESNLEWLTVHQNDLERYYNINDGSTDEDDGTNLNGISLLTLTAISIILVIF